MKIQHTRGPWTVGDGHLWHTDKATGMGYRFSPIDFHGGCLAWVAADDGDSEATPNASMIALAPTAPHDCDHEGCPGRENKRKLEAAAEIVNAARELIAGADREGGSMRSVHRYDVDQLRTAISRWEGKTS